MKKPGYSMSFPFYFVLVCAVMLFSAGCDNGETPVAEKKKEKPEIIVDLDKVLSKPYEEHFSNNQGDFAVAIQIGYKVQKIIENADPMSMKNAMELMDPAQQLEDSPTKGNYKRLVDAWHRVKANIRLRN